MNRQIRRSIAVWSIPLSAVAGAALAVDEFEISRSTIDGGGTMESTGGEFSLAGTIGQPDAGVMTGGDQVTGVFELTGGFWFQTPLGDCNETGIVNLLDYDEFETCMHGPTSGVDTGCECFDVDRDGSVNLQDFSTVQSAF